MRRRVIAGITMIAALAALFGWAGRALQPVRPLPPPGMQVYTATAQPSVAAQAFGGQTSAATAMLANTATPAPTATPVPTATAAPSRRVTVVAVGDVMLGRRVYRQMEAREDIHWPFAETAAVLQNADLTLGNLEMVLVDGCIIKEEGMLLCGPPDLAPALVAAGFDGLSVANNHRMDYGAAGGVETMQVVTDAGLTALHEGAAAVWAINGVRIGVVGIDDVLAYAPLETMTPMVADLRAEVDVMLAVIHWGWEYDVGPNPRQQYLSEQLAAMGFDVVIGAHPHWVQGVEWYGETLVFYSLGNFVFDQMWSPETRRGAVLELTIDLSGGTRELDYQLIPVEIVDFGQPQMVETTP